MKEELLARLAPVIEFLDRLDPAEEGAAERLNAEFPIDGEAMQEIAELFARGVSRESLCYRQGGPGVSYSRISKSCGTRETSIDAVRMNRAGPGHVHPNGEFDLCFPVAGAPKFDGREPGWTVYPPNSWHEPTVSGGTMNILYFLPGGAIEFGARRDAE